MRNTDVKKCIYVTKRNLTAVDVNTMISAIKSKGRVIKDRTGEGFLYSYWKGQTPFPILPEESGLLFLGASFSIVATFAGNALKQDPMLTSLSRVIECSSLLENNRVGGKLMLHTCAHVPSAEVYIYPVVKPLKVIMCVQAGPAADSEAKRESLLTLLSAGGWPVTLECCGQSLTPRHTTGGTAEWSEEKNRLEFTLPGVSTGGAVSAFAKTLRAPGVKIGRYDHLWCHLSPPGEALESWQALNRYLREIEAAAFPALTYHLNDIEWRPNGYDSFAAMAKMHDVFDKDKQLMTRMFEFEFAGQRGFMELAHEKTGYCGWFSFDDPKPFKELQKAIGYPLKQWP